MAGLILLAAALAGVGVVIFDAVAGRTAAWIVGACMLIGATCLWVLVPLPGRRRQDNSY